MPADAWMWLLAGVCALMSGMAKTGVPGLGILAVPLLALAIGGDSRASTGLLLPLLCLADCFAVFWYRKHARWDHIGKLLPWVVAGMVPGYLTLDWVDPARVNLLIGGIVLAMLALHVWRRRAKEQEKPRAWMAPLFGLVAGYVTTVSNAAGPVMNLYLLSMGFSKDAFMGTGAWYFFIINLVKVPIYLLVDPPMITAASLMVDAWLIPAVIAGALTGRWLYARLPQKVFDVAVMALTAMAAIRMMLM